MCPLVYLKSDISCFLAGFLSCDGLSVRLIVAGLLFRQGVPPYAYSVDGDDYLPRTASFNSLIASCTLPAALSALPSVSSFLSPKTFPAASFTAPLACSAEPLIRSLSILAV
jgi:hypothetical protein